MIFGIGVAGVIYAAGVESVNGDLSPGSFMSFFGAMMLMLQPLRRITNINATLQRGIAAGDSHFRIIDEPDEVDSGSYVADRVEGTVEFRNVGFSYDDSTAVLRDVSFEVAAGKSIAIVGHSGSGKSTLIGLLPRFYDADSGEVLLDGRAVQDGRTSAWSARTSSSSTIPSRTILRTVSCGAAAGRRSCKPPKPRT